jgi:rhomboid protease GluP
VEADWSPSPPSPPPSPSSLIAVRETDDATRAGDWAVVLAAAGIAHELRESGGAAAGESVPGRLALVVEARDREAARRALEAFDAEAKLVAEAASTAGPSWERPSALGYAVAVLLAGVYLVAGPREAAEPSAWFGAGTASAERILHGQWWRAVTAMTLHADLLHLAGNLVASLIFISAVGRWLGSGLGAALILLAGGAANLLVAAAHRTGHLSVGASTATFAALGIMAGLQVVRHFRAGPLRRRAWLPIGAGLGLFAMLGVGAQADVLAHLFGLGAGCLLGMIAARVMTRRPGTAAQALLGVAAAASLAACWWRAFRG